MLVMGDLMMVVYGIFNWVILDVIVKELGELVVDCFVIGVWIIYVLFIIGVVGFNIGK